MLMNISMFYKLQINCKGASDNICCEKMKSHVDWKKIEILQFFVFVLVMKTFHLQMHYIPLYGDKTPSEYVCIHLNLAKNYCLTILHLSVKK